MRRPMILRLASDEFMPELAALLDDDPERLAEIEARPGETWRNPPDKVALPDSDATLLTTAARRVLGARFKQTSEWRAQELSAEQRALRTKKQQEREARQRKRREKEKKDDPPPPVLKLFQPSHQRFYLVAASLVCRFPGLPDHKVDPAKQESVSFVVRRLVPNKLDATTFNPEDCTEHAFVTTPDGPRWEKVRSPVTADAPPELVAGEDRLPMFSTPFIGEDGVKRRLVTGLVPVSRREVYVGAPAKPTLLTRTPVPAPVAGPPADPKLPPPPDIDDSPAFPEPIDPRAVLFINDVVAPWRVLGGQARKLRRETLAGVAKSDRESARDHADQVRNQIRFSSWYILLDLSSFLDKYVPNVSVAIEKNDDSGLETAQERDLFAALNSIRYTAKITKDKLDPVTENMTLATALRRIEEHRDSLENATTLLTKDTSASFAAYPAFSFVAIGPPEPDFGLRFTEEMAGPGPNRINELLEKALDPADPTPTPPMPAAAQLPLPLNASTRFVMRCVYDRPLCGVGHTVVSEPTEPFAMAAFFDPDAPARSVRIALPVDTSPAGLRKYQKSASFLISDMLCGQMGASRKLTLGDLVLSVLPWPFHKDLPEPKVEPCENGIGMICSLSIPIVTICAIILLIIIVTILDIFFRWIPFLITCFPFPLKAKEQL